MSCNIVANAVSSNPSAGTKGFWLKSLFGLWVFAACFITVMVAQAHAQQDAPSFSTLWLPERQQHIGAATPLKSPAPQPEPSLEVPSLKLRNQPGYEEVTVTVTDSSNRYVTDLKADDFHVFENDQRRPVAYAHIDRRIPVSVGIIVDCSTSMASKLAVARAAITRMVNDLDPDDDIFLEAFSARAALLQPFTFDHQDVIERLTNLRPVSWTSLYDAIYGGLHEVVRGGREKRALVVVTDGMDNGSRIRRKQVIDTARAMKVLIYSIGIGEQMVDSERGFFELLTRSDSDEVDMNILRTLSDETGARAFNLPRIEDGKELADDCEKISSELRQQYTIAYVSPDLGRHGYRQLRVEVPGHPELSVRVRKGVVTVPE